MRYTPLTVALLLSLSEAALADPCPPPLPTAPGGFRRARTVLAIEVAGPPNHRGQDVLAPVGAPQVLVAKMAYGVVDKDLKDEDVDVLVQRGGSCSAWELLGTVRTTREGEIPDVRLGTWDDGGRVLVEVPEDRRLPVGRHAVRARAQGDGSFAAFWLWVVPAGVEIAVFDVDGTLTGGDGQLWHELAEAAEGERSPAAVRDGAKELVLAWAAKGVLPVYLTGRPDTLRSLTERWLREQGFPPGVVRHADRLRETAPTDESVGRFKVRVLRELEGRGAKLRGAYGNASTDSYAFREAGVPAGRSHVLSADASWAAEAARVAKEPKARVAAPTATGW